MKEKLKIMAQFYSTTLYNIVQTNDFRPFFERPTDFSGSRANFKIRTC